MITIISSNLSNLLSLGGGGEGGNVHALFGGGIVVGSKPLPATTNGEDYHSIASVRSSHGPVVPKK